jgi:hypothetical protein
VRYVIYIYDVSRLRVKKCNQQIDLKLVNWPTVSLVSVADEIWKLIVAKYIVFFVYNVVFSMPPNVHIDFVVTPSGCGRSVTDVWGWGARRAHLRCGVPWGVLNLNSTSYPDHGRYGDLPLQGKIPTAEPEIEPGTSWLIVRSSDFQATRLVSFIS